MKDSKEATLDLPLGTDMNDFGVEWRASVVRYRETKGPLFLVELVARRDGHELFTAARFDADKRRFIDPVPFVQIIDRNEALAAALGRTFRPPVFIPEVVPASAIVAGDVLAWSGVEIVRVRFVEALKPPKVKCEIERVAFHVDFMSDTQPAWTAYSGVLRPALDKKVLRISTGVSS